MMSRDFQPVNCKNWKLVAKAVPAPAVTEKIDGSHSVIQPAVEVEQAEVVLVGSLSKKFIMGGNAVFTIQVPADAQERAKAKPHYTFKVKSFKTKDGQQTLFSVSLLSGPNNDADYQYLGMLDVNNGTVRLTSKSQLTDDAAPVKLLRWALSHLWSGSPMPDGWKMHHEGRCARCGRTLTTPESIELGFGPECAKF